jgi:DNA-binding NarL/FixJ family response regulator
LEFHAELDKFNKYLEWGIVIAWLKLKFRFMKVPIALVEDNPSLRKRFIDHFKYFQNVSLELVAVSGEDFLNKIEVIDPLLRPQVVLMDIEMPGINGIETTKRLKEIYPDIDVMMLTVFEDEDKIFKAVQAGAVGYLLKDEPPSGIINAILELKEGGAPMSAVIARKMLTFIKQTTGKPEKSKDTLPGGKENDFNLTDRELKIIEYLVSGSTYSEIAEKLIISPHTVKSHIKNIYKKMEVHTRASVVRTAIEKKLLD